MTVSSSYAPLSFNGNGSTTAFSVTWPFFTGSLKVTLIASTGVETVQTISTHYTVSGGTTSAGLPATGTVTMLAAPASGASLRIERVTPKTQASEWTEAGAFAAKTLEAALDRLTLIGQEGGSGSPGNGFPGDTIDLVTSGATDYYDADSKKIGNVADPTAAQDVVTKAYGDANYGGAAAIAAAASATAAGSSATNAAASATSAAAAMALFENLWQGPWTTARSYTKNQIVAEGSNTYICVVGHTSAAGNRPASGATWDDVWDTYAQGGAVSSVAGRTGVVTLAQADISGLTKINVRGADIASASTVNLTTATGDYVTVTGTTTITAITLADGEERVVRFSGILTLTNGASLILPTGANIATAAGDVAVFRGEASSVVRCVSYQRASGQSLASAATTNIATPGGRLTLTASTPVMTATASAQTTIRYTPYVHQFVPIYNGTTFVMTDTGGELTQATTDNTKSPAAVTTNSNYDLFVWNDAGTIRCTRGPAWTSDTARGTGAGTTELTRVQGIFVNANAITNGPAANRGTYVGSVRSNGSSQIDFIYGTKAAGGGAASLGVWNMYNRIPIGVSVEEDTNGYTYNSSTIRAANGSTTNRISFLVGVADGAELVQYQQRGLTGANASEFIAVGVGLDSTTAMYSGASQILVSGNAVTGFPNVVLPVASSLGWHYWQALEQTGALAAGTFNQFNDFAALRRIAPL